MSRRLLAVLIAAVLSVAGVVVVGAANASPADEYTTKHFGAGDSPPGCERDTLADYADNACYHMRTGLNALDSPQVDVLILVPVSPTVERDVRIMRQAVQMWEGGIHNLSPQIGLPWLGKGMHFHITVDTVDPNGGGGEFTTYPIVDPEIVVVATNPVGGVGIGIDPVATGKQLGLGDGQGPCHGLHNPFDFDAWNKVPGFERHHEQRVGTYVEDCGGAGGNICFAINGAIDPAPAVVDVFSLFDLVAHEFGHCLTVGHVGDGAEGPWGKVPTNDIMSYNSDPVGLNKCVSTLDVEGIAVTMSHYLDVNGDHAVTPADYLLANDQPGDGRNAFQTQHPRDHWYASGTGRPTDCPQPDLGLSPGSRTNWKPAPVKTSVPVLTVTSPADDATSADGKFNVAGTVAHVSLIKDPTSPTGTYDDADNDATSPMTEITSLDVAVTRATVESTIHLVSLPPTGTTATSPTSYSTTIDGRRFESFVRYPAADPAPITWDAGAGAYMPKGTSTWDTAAKTVTFHIPRDYLKKALIEAPYEVASLSSFGFLNAAANDDHAPETGHTIGVANARVIATPTPSLSPRESTQTVTFKHEGGNTFYPEQSTLGEGVTQVVGLDPSHTFRLNVPQASDVAFRLDWTDAVGGSDLDLRVRGAANSGAQGTSDRKPEVASLTEACGRLSINVEPVLVTDKKDGSTYTLTAVLTPKPASDTDNDCVPNNRDLCPTVAGIRINGCPPKIYEHVYLYVDGTKVATQDANATSGPASFAMPVTLSKGLHTLRLEWEANGRVLTAKSWRVSRAVPHRRGNGPRQGRRAPLHR